MCINFIEHLMKEGVIGLKPEGIKLKSGRTSYWYANCRNLTNTTRSTKKTATFLTDFIADIAAKSGKPCGDFNDYIYGVPEGATKLALTATLSEGDMGDTSLIMGRGKSKAHGDPKDKYFIGPIKEDDKVVVLEDVTTTGGSLIAELEKLKEARVNVVLVVALFNRNQRRDDGLSVEEYLNKQSYKYAAMCEAVEYLPLLKNAGTEVNPWTDVDWELIKQEMRETGTKPIEWELSKK